MAHGTMPAELAAVIVTAFNGLGARSVAVRSSATAEDLPEMSFAGQQDTYLNVRGADAVLDAVKRCWASLWTARAIGYRARHAISGHDVALAVVVQELVPADAAGILFTADPRTGAREMMVVNAAWGLGDSIVGGHVTPDTFIVNARTGVVESQEISDKAVMTLRVPEGTREGPVPADQRQRASLSRRQVVALAAFGRRIEHLYGRPMDIEWALTDGRLFMLQARPITALPAPPPVLDWTPPHASSRYFRGSVIELLPDPLSPLFATMALPCWNASMRTLMTEFAPRLKLSAHMNELTTINEYAYYEFGLTARQWLRLIGLMAGRFRPILARTLGRAEARWAEEGRPQYVEVTAKWSGCDVRHMPATRLLEGAREIVERAADYYLTIQSGILPSAFMSEALFTIAYNRLAKRPDDPPALTFVLGFDSAPISAEKSLYDLAQWARAHAELVNYVSQGTSAGIASAYFSGNAPIPVADRGGWVEFRRRFGNHLDQFGHTVYDLDFAKRLPAEAPEPLIDALKQYLTGQAPSPYDRQARSAYARAQATQALLARLKGPRAGLFKRLLPWAQRYAPLREDALADVGLGWPVLRRMIREMGQRLVTVNVLADRDDVFWLTLDEAAEAARAIDTGQPVPDYRGRVDPRRATWEQARSVTPPAALPIKGGARILGIDFSAWGPARTNQAGGSAIKGQGASPGRVTGPARVIRGPAEFGTMESGDILVARITTPAWTPLFALAAGIVTDVGGALSHSSIVAREYHIPAVLGTGIATERIRSGQRITVDGDHGVVSLSISRPGAGS
jgi:pyruvate,water dikinase